MSIFSKPEVIILKESSDAKIYLNKLEELLPKVNGELQEKIEKEMAIVKAGLIGEENILFELKHSKLDLIVLHDIYIETNEGMGAQIDFIVVTPKINFIIECKNLYGDIEIDSKGNFIRTFQYGNKKWKEGIYSPITQNQRHLLVLKECKSEDKNLLEKVVFRSAFERYNMSLVVLANPKTVVNDRYAKKEIKEQVIRADQLITVMQRIYDNAKEMPSSKKEMMKIAQGILNKNIENRKEYIRKYENLVYESKKECDQINIRRDNSINYNESTNDLKSKIKGIKLEEYKHICPKCGAKLVERVAKKGDNAGQRFWGCTNYPKCKYTKAIY